MSEASDTSYVSEYMMPTGEQQHPAQANGTQALPPEQWVETVKKQLVSQASETTSAGDIGIPKAAYTNLEKLSSLFGISKDEYEDWVASDLFRPMWETLLNETIAPRRKIAADGGPSFKSPQLPHIQAAINKDLSTGSLKYDTPNPDKSEWKMVDDYAYFLYHVRKQNTQNPNGLFFNKKLHVLTVDALIWQAFRRCMYQRHYPKAEKPKEAKPKKQVKRPAETTADAPKKVAKVASTIKEAAPKVPVNNVGRKIQLGPELTDAITSTIKAEIQRSIPTITDQVCRSLAAAGQTMPPGIPSFAAQGLPAVPATVSAVEMDGQPSQHKANIGEPQTAKKILEETATKPVPTATKLADELGDAATREPVAETNSDVQNVIEEPVDGVDLVPQTTTIPGPAAAAEERDQSTVGPTNGDIQNGVNGPVNGTEFPPQTDLPGPPAAELTSAEKPCEAVNSDKQQGTIVPNSEKNSSSQLCHELRSYAEHAETEGNGDVGVERAAVVASDA